MTIAAEKNPPVKLPNEPTITPQIVAEHGLAPDEYERQCLILDQGEERDQRAILRRLVELQYERNDAGFTRNKFRVRRYMENSKHLPHLHLQRRHYH